MTIRDDFLPAFRTTTSVDEKNAMIDRVQLEVGDWSLVGSNDDIIHILNHLNTVNVSTASGREIPLFAPASVRNLNYKVEVRIGEGNRGATPYSVKPVFSGVLSRVGRRHNQLPNLSRGAVRLSYKTNLNLTRFLQAQRFARTRDASRTKHDGEFAFAIQHERDWHLQEIPLMAATNVILGQVHRFGYCRRHSLEEHCSTYLDQVSLLMNRVIEHRMSDEGVRVIHSDYRSLSACEVYWEFSDPNPIDLVTELAEPLMRLSAEYSARHQGVEDVREQVTSDSLAITIKLTHGVRLRVYAKTTMRVRFEFVFQQDAIQSIANGQICYSNESTVGKLSSLKEWALDEINWVLTELHRDIPVHVPQRTTVGLVSKITSIVRNEATCEAVIAALHTFGRLAPQRNEPMLLAARALRIAGVLRPLRRNSPIYVVTDEYEAAQRGLASL